MIEIVDNVLCVSNWEKYQNTSTLNRIREQTVRVMCKCEEEAFKKRVEEEKQRHHDEYIQLLRETGLPYGLRTATFENDNSSNPELTARVS